MRQSESQSVEPPGLLRPESERAARAWAALERRDFRAVESNLAALHGGQPTVRVWKPLIKGCMAIGRGECAAAVEWLLQAVGAASILAARQSLETQSVDRQAPEGSSKQSILQSENRLWALAVEKLGVAYRRLDAPDEARQSHDLAYRLRVEFGTVTEQWESANSLGLDADLAGRYDDAIHWHQVAIDHARALGEVGWAALAESWQQLSASLMRAGRHEEAVSAAREACTCRRRHDPGTIESADAVRTLGRALLGLGEATFERDAGFCRAALDEATVVLTGAYEALSAFGPRGLADAQSCLEQRDFAERLRASLPE